MGNRGSSRAKGGAGGGQGLGSAKQQARQAAKLLRRRQQQQQNRAKPPNGAPLLSHHQRLHDERDDDDDDDGHLHDDDLHHLHQHNLHHQQALPHFGNYAFGQYPFRPRPLNSASSNDLSASHLQPWAPASQRSRAARRANHHHYSQHHLNYRANNSRPNAPDRIYPHEAEHYDQDQDQEEDEFAYQQVLGLVDFRDLQHEEEEEGRVGEGEEELEEGKENGRRRARKLPVDAGAGPGSSQTYPGTPLASSGSSSHSTAAASATTTALAAPAAAGAYADQCPGGDECPDSGHLLDEFAPAPRRLRDHLSHSRQLNAFAHSRPRCLDACCNSATGFARARARVYPSAGAARPRKPAPSAGGKQQQQQQQQQPVNNLAQPARRRPTRMNISSNSNNSNNTSANNELGASANANANARANLNGIMGPQVGTSASAGVGGGLPAAQERGLAFSESERKRLNLLGLLPVAVQDQELQARAVLNFLERCQDELAKYAYLRHLKDFNEKLFYYTLTRNVGHLMPLVYTPTVGLACQKFSEIYMRPRGLWVSSQDAGRVRHVLANWAERDVRVIVVTDGERILGLGDLGANGMGISIGKLSLYTALAGIAPANVLPVTLDVGTNNETLLRDPFYIGLRRKRTRGPEYEALVDEFLRAVVQRWGRSCLVQFEDFANSNAFALLKRHRHDYCTFNDDIQGTAAVALAGLLTAVRQTGKRLLSDCNLLFYGAGEANLGTAHLAIMAMLDEGATRAEAKRRIWLVDSKGLVVASRADLNEHKAELAQELAQGAAPPKTLEEIIDLVRPLAIVGASAQGGAFTRSILEKMAKHNERPVVFALSNPTSKAECTAQQAYEATRGACLFASGSPFEPVHYEGRTFLTGQGNNAYIFPGVGLAAIGAHTHTIPEETFLVAARALSAQVTQQDLDQGLVYPNLDTIREVTLRVATRVLEFLYAERLATYRPEPSDKRAFLEAIQYDPRY